ncbi:uncharacterized protein [Nicotiana tomentosiformis]|uniref:uncharacterized protein n=1 Tax=Nicotiana tomentosiformis TaxID=4098 RepID=UPI00388C7A98
MVGILVDRDLRELVVDVKRVNDRLMAIKLVVGGLTLSMVSAYALQAGLGEEVKRQFWEDLDEVVREERGPFGDYLLCRKRDSGLCTDYKVIPSEWLSTQHKLLVMDLEIKREKEKRVVFGQPKIKWEALPEDKAQELGEKFLDMEAWRSCGDASSMWSSTANCIREAVRTVLGVTRGFTMGHKGDWW